MIVFGCDIKVVVVVLKYLSKVIVHRLCTNSKGYHKNRKKLNLINYILSLNLPFYEQYITKGIQVFCQMKLPFLGDNCPKSDNVVYIDKLITFVYYINRIIATSLPDYVIQTNGN